MKFHRRACAITLLFLLALISQIFSQANSLRYTGQTLKDIIQLPEDQIDIGLACLVFAKEVYPEIDVNQYLNLIDRMAYNVHKISKGVDDPEARIGALNTFLYRPGRWNGDWIFEYDLEDLEAIETKNQFLNGYLDTHQGSCITMPMLHVVIGQRLKWPIYAVAAPKHFFCRYVEPGFEKSNIEATAGGGFNYDLEYITDTDIPKKAIDNGVYMRTLTNKEYIGKLLTTVAGIFFKQGKIGKAIEYLNISIDLDSTDSGAYWDLGTCYFKTAIDLKNKMEFEIKQNQVAMEIENRSRINQRNRTIVPQSQSIVAQSAYSRINIPTQNNVSSLPSANHSYPTQTDQYLFADIQAKYIPQINQLVGIAKSYRKKANDLGIVLEFPELFLKKQMESINQYLKKGGY